MGAIFILPDCLPVEIGWLLLLNLDPLSGYSKLEAAPSSPSFGDKMCSQARDQ